MAIYVDIGISVIFVIAVLVGAIKGFAKQFNKVFCGFLGLIGAIALTVLIVPALQKAGLINSFSSVATNWFKKESFTTVIASHEELTDVMSSGSLKILSKLSSRIWFSMQTYQMGTLGEYFGDLCARVISGVVIWIALLLLFKLVFWAIRFLLKKLSKLPVLRTLDKIFGALWGLVIAVVVMFVLITTFEIVIIKWMPNAIDLQSLVNDSAVYQFLHEINVAGAQLAKMMGIDLAALSPVV